MKLARFILKIVATAMAVAAVVCAIFAFWDQIIDKVEEKRADRCFEPEEFDDFADYDDSIM